MQGIAEKIGAGGALYDTPGIHHVDRVAHFRDHGEIVGDENDGGAEIPLAVADEVEHLFLDGDVEGGGGFVADEEFGFGDQCHGDHHALAHAAGELVGVGMDALFGIGDADLGEGVDGAGECGFSAELLVEFERLGELVADAHEGVERGHRILEDHRDALAADFQEFLLGSFEEIGAGEHGGAALDAAGWHGDEAKQGIAGDRFAGAGLADDPEGLALVHGEGHVLHGMDGAVAGVETGG